MSRPLATLSAATGLVAIGGLGGAALATRPDPPPARVAAIPPAPVETRTIVIHRTVHVYRHPKHRRVAVTVPAPRPVAATTALPPAAVTRPAAPAPLVTRTSQHAAPAHAPLVTRTSGAAGRGHGGDGGEDGGGDD